MADKGEVTFRFVRKYNVIILGKRIGLKLASKVCCQGHNTHGKWSEVLERFDSCFRNDKQWSRPMLLVKFCDDHKIREKF